MKHHKVAWKYKFKLIFPLRPGSERKGLKCKIASGSLQEKFSKAFLLIYFYEFKKTYVKGKQLCWNLVFREAANLKSAAWLKKFLSLSGFFSRKYLRFLWTFAQTHVGHYQTSIRFIRYTNNEVLHYLSIALVNVTKSAGNCGFGHIYWRNL